MKKRVIMEWWKSLRPGMTLRELWREFHSFCRWHRLGDIHTQEKPLRLLTKLFAWDWVQLIREDYGEDHLSMPLEQRLKHYKAMKNIFPEKGYRQIVKLFVVSR